MVDEAAKIEAEETSGVPTDLQSIRTFSFFGNPDIEMRRYTGRWISVRFAGNHLNTASLQISTMSPGTGYTEVGRFDNTVRDDAVGTHPTDGATTLVQRYRINQYTTGIDESQGSGLIAHRPLKIDDNGELVEMTDTEIREIILDPIIKEIVDQGQFTCGQYRLEAAAPSTTIPAGASVTRQNADVGTWTDRGTISDTQVDGTTVTKTLWQKTSPRGYLAPGGNRTLLYLTDDGEITEFTHTELYTFDAMLRNRILANNIGRYVFDTAAPTTGGTWQQMGETMTDQRKQTATYAYAGTYTGSYSGTYTGYYTGTYTGYYTGSYAADYGGFAGTSYSGDYAGDYTGTYAGDYTGSYSGDYTGTYDGVTIISSSETVSSKKLFVRIA
jgi:hypothetical protein